MINDDIRQKISSSPISLSKIFTAPITSAPALVSRTSMHVCTFRLLIEQRAVMRFLTFKSLLAPAIAAELQSVDEIDAFALPTVKKWRKRFAERRTLSYDDPRCGKLLAND
jgi:hypothetical protein